MEMEQVQTKVEKCFSLGLRMDATLFYWEFENHIVIPTCFSSNVTYSADTSASIIDQLSFPNNMAPSISIWRVTILKILKSRIT